MQTLRTGWLLRRTATLLLLLAVLGGGLPRATSPASSVKIDPYLAGIMAANPGGNVAVIVKGDDKAALLSAIQHHGGQLGADLWLINSVAAVLPAAQVDGLAAEDSVLAVSPDKPVEEAGGPGDRTAPNRLNGTFYTPGTVSLDPVTDSNGNAFVFSQLAGIYSVNKIGPTGTLLWTIVLGLGSSYQPFGGAVAANGDFIVTTVHAGVFALRPTALLGRAWVTHGVDPSTAPAIGADGTIYYGSSKFGVALKPTGGLKWQRTFKDNVSAVPSPITGGAIFLTGSGGASANFVAADNSRAWTYSSAYDNMAGPVVDSAGRLLFATGHYALALDASSGAQTWRSGDLGGQTVGRPMALAAGLVAILVAGVGVAGVDGASGASQWTAALNNVDGNSKAALAAGRFVGVSRGNSFTAIDGNNGAASGVLYALDNGNNILSLTGANNGFFYAYSSKGRFLELAQDASLYWSYSLSVAWGATSSWQWGQDRDDNSGSSNLPTNGIGLGVAPDGSVFAVDSASQIEVLGSLPQTVDSSVLDVSAVDLLNNRMKLAYNAAIDTGADLVYRRGITGRGVTVAVIDSGVHYDALMHLADTRTQYAGQVDLVNGGTNPPLTQLSTDPYGHGSHVASIILNPLVDQLTNTYIGMAPDARVVSVRVLDGLGQGSYSTVIAGLQWVVAHKDQYGIKVANYSIVAHATAPYWADPLDVAAERVWQAGVLLVAAAGNDGPGAMSVSVPANSPYVLTVGALNGNRTAGKWGDDYVDSFSAAGPTLDGFAKPDVVAPGSRIVGFMSNVGADIAYLTTIHPDAALGFTFYRMSGTSQATAIVSGIAALVLQQNPGLTPGQIKYRLMATAMPFVNQNGSATYSIFQQGTGRVWAPAAVFAALPASDADAGLNMNADLGSANASNVADYSSSQYVDPAWRATHPAVQHYQGPASYNATLGKFVLTGTSDSSIDGSYLSWGGGYTNWAGGYTNWAGGYTNWAGGFTNWAGGLANWAGGFTNWAGGYTNWAGGFTNWAWPDSKVWTRTQRR